MLQDHLPNNALPMRSEPHDDLRYGLSTLKEEAAVSHPVEALERTVRSYPPASKYCLAALQTELSIFSNLCSVQKKLGIAERRCFAAFMAVPFLQGCKLSDKYWEGALSLQHLLAAV